MGKRKDRIAMKKLCHTCLVLLAFRWDEADCADCDRLNRSVDRLAA